MKPKIKLPLYYVYSKNNGVCGLAGEGGRIEALLFTNRKQAEHWAEFKWGPTKVEALNSADDIQKELADLHFKFCVLWPTDESKHVKSQQPISIKDLINQCK